MQNSWVIASIVIVSLFPQIVCGQDRPESMDGEWTVESSLVNGKEATNLYEAWIRKGGFWKLHVDGTGEIADYVTKWKYDKESGQFTIQQRNLGIWFTSIERASTVKKDGLIHLTFKMLGQDWNLSLKKKGKEGDDIKVVLGSEIVDKYLFSEPLETVSGFPRKFTLRRDYEKSVTITATVGTEVSSEVNGGVTVAASISAGVKAKIEASLGTTIGTRETFEETYELDGKTHTKIKVKWYERYRQGTMILSDGTTKKFQICVGLRTVPELP